MKVSIAHSDAIVAGSEALSPTLTKFIESSNKPFLPFANKDTLKEVYTSFIKNYLL
jgi:starch synthase